MSIFIKCVMVIESCKTGAQVSVALRFLTRAEKGNHIPYSDWDLLHRYLSQKLKRICEE